MKRTLLSAREAGYRIRFIDVKASRAPEYDSWALRLPSTFDADRPRSEDDVKRLMKETV